MHTPTNYEYIKEKYRKLGKPVPKALDALSEVYVSYGDRKITGEWLYSLLLRLCKSYECYSALNKSEEEWDEYDHMMFPVWVELAEFMEISK